MKSRDRATLLVTLALVAVLSACGGADDKNAPIAQDVRATPSAAADLAKPVVKLLDAGVGPREALRFTLVEGAIQRASMRMQTETRMTIDGEAAPAVEVPATVLGIVVEVDEVRPDGVIAASFVYDSVRAEGSGAAAGQVEDALQDILGVTGRMEFTDTGAYIGGELDIPADMDENMRTTLSSMETQLSNFNAPFPEEEIGLGATWTVTTQTAINGIRAENLYRYELVKRTDEGIVLDGTLTITATAQEPEIPGLPPGGRVRLDRMEMSGTLRVEIDLSQLLPVASSTSSAGEFEMTIEEDGTTSTMVQEMKMDMDLRLR